MYLFCILSYLLKILFYISILSISVGSFLTLYEKNFKRLLAYSAIAHFGYILLALSFADPNGVTIGIFYLLIYCFSTIIIFSILIINFEKINEKLMDGVETVFDLSKIVRSILY